jgi:hypothetical protein
MITQTQDDFDAGYRDRTAGYYDKWYRYNRTDDGAAYDAGVKAAIDSGNLIIAECHIIDCVKYDLN